MKLNKSEKVILQIVRKEIKEGITKRYRKTKDGDIYFYRLKRYDNAIDSLIEKGLIFINNCNLIKEVNKCTQPYKYQTDP